MNKLMKTLAIICFMLIICMGLSAASAADSNDNAADSLISNDNAVDSLSTNDNTINSIGSDENAIDSPGLEAESAAIDSPGLEATSANDDVLSAYVPDPDGKYVSSKGSDTTGDGSYSKPYASIQKAVDAVEDGYAVYISAGTYKLTSPISINKQLTISSYNGEVILDGQGRTRIFTLKSGAGPLLQGLTIKNGHATNGGVADLSTFDKGNNTFTISNCSFINNTAELNGGAFYIVTDQTSTGRSNIRFSNCSFIDNSAGENGGVFYSMSSSDGNHTATGCLFLNNNAKKGGTFWSQGMLTFNIDYSVLINNTNTPYYSQMHRSGSYLSNSYWGTNNPESFLTDDNIAAVVLESYLKIAILSDVDTITREGYATLTMKFIRNDGVEYGSNFFIPQIYGILTSENGTLSKTSGYLSFTGFDSNFKPSAIGNLTITGTAEGETVSKTIEVLPEPMHVSPNGSGDGSLEYPCSLEYAISKINSGTASNNIIELADGNYVLSNPLTITANTTIRPYKTSNVSISGNGIFIIQNNADVRIYNLTLANSRSTNGAVFVENGSLTVLSSVFANNSCAIYGRNANIDVSYSQFVNNGGDADNYAIYNEGSATITANNNWWASNSKPTSQNKQIFGDATVDTWLMAYLTDNRDPNVLRTNWNDTITITLKTSSNEELDNEAYVKPIIVSFSTNTGSLTNSKVTLSRSNNYSADTVIFGITENATVTATIDNQMLENNYTFEVPMNEIYVSTTGDDENGNGSLENPFKTINRALIIADEEGAIIYMAAGTYDYIDYVAINNRILTITSYNGEAIIDRTTYYDVFNIGNGAEVSINGLSFKNGYNKYSSRSAIKNYGTLTITNCLFTNGTGGGFGEYIENSGGHLEVYNSHFTDSKVVNSSFADAAIFLSSGYAYVEDCLFQNNGEVNPETRESSGSGIIVTGVNLGETAFRNNGGTLIANRCTFTNSTGAVSMVYQNGDTTIKNSLIENTKGSVALNIASGKAVSLTVENCTFTNNTAGAIGIEREEYAQENALKVYDSRFINNNRTKGGAIYTQLAYSIIDNCIFINNTAENGGAIYNLYGAMDVFNCTFQNNSAINRGGSIFINSTSENTALKENIIENSSAEIGGAIYTNGLTELVDNHMTDCTAINGSYIYNDNRVGHTYVIVMDNRTITMKRGDTIELYAYVCDDMKNPITGGNVTFKINNVIYNATAVEGHASLNCTLGIYGTYTVEGNYTGSRRYITQSQNAKLIIQRNLTSMSCTNVNVKAYPNYAYFKFTLKNSTGSVLGDKTVKVYFNGKTYTVKTNANGVGTCKIYANAAKTYAIKATFNGDSIYEVSTASAKVIVSKNSVKITAKTKKVKKSNSKRTVKFLFKTSNGKVLKSKKLKLTINGKTYSAKTNSKGIATFKVKLAKKKKTYKYKVKFAGDRGNTKKTFSSKLKVY